jgi:photosystem II stability/assembly factor-like uncharacterized protein
MKNPTFLIKILAYSFSVMFLFHQCERNTFPNGYHDIYGNWTIRSISGGFTGGGIKPRFDILSIQHGMSFSIYRNDTLLSKGTIEILRETDDYLEADFNSKDNYICMFGTKTIRLSNDTLILSDNCADCYSAFFVRSEVYSNTNYIQSNKMLPFVDVSNYPIRFEKYCNSVYFQSEALGFITCSDGSILRSTDGGKNWQQVENKNKLPLYGIAFINERIGFAVGGQSYCGGTGCKVPGYLMLKTSDGGETWDSVPLPYKQADLKSIKFYSSNFGITVGTGAGLLTKDGGQTWNDITDENIKGVFNFFLLNQDVAYLTGLKGQLFKTSNGGATWQNLSFESPYYIQSVMFLNEQVGFISLYNSLLKTTDGGLSWKRMDYAPVSATTINFSDETNGIVFGSRTYASNKWDVWDSFFNIMINGKWYGDARITSHSDPYCLNAKTYYTITWDNKVSVIKLTNIAPGR